MGNSVRSGVFGAAEFCNRLPELSLNASGDPLGASRVTLLGNVLPIPEQEVAEARRLYLAARGASGVFNDTQLTCSSVGTDGVGRSV